MEKLLPAMPLVFVDVETTGGSATQSRIIEIAILRVENGVVVKKFESVIDPESYLPPSITAITGITKQDTAGAPTFVQCAQEIFNMLEGAVFVAHNVRFDYAFVKNELKRAGISFNAKCLCTVKISRALFPKFKRHDLSSIIERFSLECEDRHRAMADAKVMIDFLGVCYRHHSAEKIDAAVSKIMKSASVPIKIKPEVIERLPESPGVYIFYGEQDERLYIGKSINIKNRVMSHFAADHRSGKEMRLAQETVDIETITTSGDLSALLLESDLIKKYQPLYNRMSRHSKKLLVLHECVDKDGYKCVEIVKTEHDEVQQEGIVGIFRSLSQAKKVLEEYAKEFTLCPKLLGLEKGAACFYVQIGKCKGACLKKESAEDYNARFDKAFASRKVRTWPYKGPVVIVETNRDDETSGTAFVVDNWRISESYTYDEVGKREFLSPAVFFEYDSYKILHNYMRTHPHSLTMIKKVI